MFISTGILFGMVLLKKKFIQILGLYCVIIGSLRNRLLSVIYIFVGDEKEDHNDNDARMIYNQKKIKMIYNKLCECVIACIYIAYQIQTNKRSSTSSFCNFFSL